MFVNGVNTELFYPRDKIQARKKFNLSNDDFVVAFVGQFTKRKGINILNEALNNIDNVKALYAGKGAEVPVGKHVIFAQAIESKEVPWLLSAADIFVFPSQHEGCSNAILEAMACGLPVIASDLEFNYDILDEKNSILVNGLSVEGVEIAIRKLMNDSNLRNDMSVETLRKIKNLSINQRAKNILEWINMVEIKC